MRVTACHVGDVFSAHAEVVPAAHMTPESRKGILRARGGSSQVWFVKLEFCVYSPRTRR